MGKLLEKRSDRSASAGIGRNFVAMMALQLGAYAMSLATFPYLARVLGPKEFGVFGYAMAIATYGTTFTEWGFNLSGPRAVVEYREDPKRLNELIWSIVCGKAVLCLISVGLLLVGMLLDRQLAADFRVVLCSWVAVVANVFTMYWLMQGLERFRLLATVVLVARFLMLPLTFLCVHGPEDVVVAALIQACGPLVAATLSVLVAYRTGVLMRPCISVTSTWRRLVQGADMFVATASISLFSSATTVILGATAGAYQVGIFSAADKIRNVGNIIPAQINQVFFPRISAVFKRQRDESARLTALGLCATQAATVMIVTFFCFTANGISGVVLGGAYSESASVLRILSVCAIVGNLSYFIGLQVLVPFDMAKIRSIIMLIGGFVNVGGAIYLIPRFGAHGAAISLLLAELTIISLYVVVVFWRRKLMNYLICGFSKIRQV
ncbi:Membrane protein involved in the export of O-antigen, teichoic acid lipoteichoic acids [Paraburkholderia unamae]|uniref:flippase n=1 Tax=Paraburkholderia unamae TaxID=219649 RepID=UPI001CAF99C0|nr:flippase [Paraburkholderia unamae]CAG9270793.1 Membrane protein involved in the export of O-antigen, teichoic acid lipoteichoic acids [Paraburkholderia unamae]